MPVAIEVVYSSVQIPNYTPGTKFGATQRNGEAQRCIFPFEALKEVSPFLEAFFLRIWIYDQLYALVAEVGYDR
jgi:hypothetical protein